MSRTTWTLYRDTQRDWDTQTHSTSSCNGFTQSLKAGKQGSICTNTWVHLTGIHIVWADRSVFRVRLFFNYCLLRAFKKHSNHQDCKVHVCCCCCVYCRVCAVHGIITFLWSILRLFLFTFVQWVFESFEVLNKISRKLQVTGNTACLQSLLYWMCT